MKVWKWYAKYFYASSNVHLRTFCGLIPTQLRLAAIEHDIDVLVHWLLGAFHINYQNYCGWVMNLNTTHAIDGNF